MEDRQRVMSLYIDQSTYEAGPVDITELLYQKVDRDQVDAIKYVMHSATESGIYYTVVYVAKKNDKKGIVGFGH